MCNKGSKVFKQFYAVMLVSPVSATRSLEVFKYPPTNSQVQSVLTKYIGGKVEPLPYLYSEKPRVEVVPLKIPLDALYR